MLVAMRFARALVLMLGFAALAIVEAAAECVSPPALESISTGEAAAGDTRSDRMGRVVAPVMVNGQGPYRFIVDTGANRSAVSQGLAQRLGLPMVGEAMVHSVHGATNAPLVAVQTLRYGDLAVPGEQMPMLQGAMLAGEQGILGVDGMQGRRLRLDFEARCIEILPANRAPVLGRGWTRLRGELRFGNLVVVQGRIGGARVNVLIDTGSNVSLANGALHQLLAVRARYNRDPAGYARAFTVGDPVVLDTAIIVPELNIGELNMMDLLLFVGDFHVFSLWGLDNEPTVLVGMDVLSQARAMAIDYQRATVYFRVGDRTRTGTRLSDSAVFRPR
jgi:predicted aspartyl protease